MQNQGEKRVADEYSWTKRKENRSNLFILID
jgi:hypothetical protein